MKQFTCKEMGGICDIVIEGETAEEVSESGKEHVISSKDEAHQQLKARMEAMSKEDNDKWWEDFKKKFDRKLEA